MNPHTPQVMALFDGHREAYGKFTYSNEVRLDGKVKGSGITVREPLNRSHWDDHLEGKEQLGIIPINPDNMVKFGAIDIDQYDLNPHTRDAVNKKIVDNHLPLVQFRSKSGGIHLFIFLTELGSAAMVQRKLKDMASFLGFGNSEIFPKQTQILKSRGDIGQWINMPYYDAFKTERYAIHAGSGEKLSLADFITYVVDYMVDPKDLGKLELGPQEELPQGPPCLQHLIQQGFPEGTRNVGLFNMGVYAKKANPDGWKTMVEKYNERFLKPQLSSQEILNVIKSLDRKEYSYTCTKQPICNFCNQSTCRTRKYGIGESTGLPIMGSLTKLDTDPPIWFIEIEDGGRLELSTEELQTPLLFQRKCMSILNIMPPVLKRESWGHLIAEMMNNINIIPVPIESTPYGRFLSLLEEFCTNRSDDNNNPECILRGLVWNHHGKHHFRFHDFIQFLDRKKFEEYGPNRVSSLLRDYKAEDTKIRIGGRMTGVFTLPMFMKELDKFTPPEIKGDTPF